YFDLVDYTSSNYYISLLPANLRGALPPAGAPEYFVAIKDNANTGPLRIWEFEADWETPTNSTFTGPTNVSVPFFATTLNCGGDSGRECIPQPDTTKGLHSIDNKLLMQLQYRNFGDYESLWVNHTVDADSSRDLAGVRWYELRDPGGTPVLHQSGTQGGFVGDLTERWMGSLAVDGQGNMAVGYSASSNTVYPSVRYAGRLKNDTLGTLQQEITMTLGTGSQDTTHRWGDYSAMTIDPVDDCTFWYTNEYYTETNPIISNWQTRIGSFKFDECTTNDLTGTVHDSGTLAGIEGARVEVTHQASNLVQTRPSHTSGSYQFPVAAGTYSVTAMAYGYQPNTVSGAVSGATVIDVPLNPATFYNFSGTVT
ncbi:MAG: carboxypeptidase regulatory-like domain-containing protein, partial [Methylococcales bacterium]|nr:carboxypeptidase regulatory-like domain-containing protein [Methylococcales bacterium]